jgi:hypothetical protein
MSTKALKNQSLDVIRGLPIERHLTDWLDGRITRLEDLYVEEEKNKLGFDGQMKLIMMHDGIIHVRGRTKEAEYFLASAHHEFRVEAGTVNSKFYTVMKNMGVFTSIIIGLFLLVSGEIIFAPVFVILGILMAADINLGE